MTVTLADIKTIVEENIEDQLKDANIVNWSNMAQNDFQSRVFVPGSTTQAITTTALSYTLSPTTIREIRRLRLQSDIDNKFNRTYNPVYTFYNGVLEVPAPFPSADTLVIDYYKSLTYFTDIEDEIDLADQFSPLYTSYIEMMYFRLPSSFTRIGQTMAELRYNESKETYAVTKKMVTDTYTFQIGIQKPKESGW